MLKFLCTTVDRYQIYRYKRYSYFSPILRTCLVFVFVLFCDAPTISADIPDDEIKAQIQELFNAGNYHYGQQEYAEALNKYRAIEHQDIISGPLLLNMGLCYIQLEQVGYAKYYFSRALKYPAVGKQAEQGIQFTREWLQRKNAILPTLASFNFYKSIQQNFGSGKAFVGFAIITNLVILAILLSWFTGNSIIRRFSNYVSLVLCIPLVFLLLAGIYTEYSAARWQPGFVVGDSYVLYEDLENQSAENEFRLMPGTEIMMRTDKKRLREDQISASADQSETQNRVYIYSSNGNEGWIKSEAIRLL